MNLGRYAATGAAFGVSVEVLRAMTTEWSTVGYHPLQSVLPLLVAVGVAMMAGLVIERRRRARHG